MAPTSRRSRSAPTPDVDIDITAPNFQAESLRVPELKALLANHNIRLASNARKADLVKAVNENILEPHRQAEEDQKRAEEEEKAKEEEELKRRVKLEKEQRSKPKSPSSVTQDPPRNFSTENPFQQSPSTDSKQNIKKPRQSLPAQRSVVDQKPSAAAASRRKTIDPRNLPIQPDAVVSSPAKVATPPTRTSQQSPKEDTPTKAARPRSSLRQRPPPALLHNADSDVNTEEEEEEEVEHQHTRKTKSRRVHREARSATAPLVSLVQWLAVTLAIVWWSWYTKESKRIGYCNTSSDSNPALAQRELSRLARANSNSNGLDSSDDESVALTDLLPLNMQPSCTPCPAHAICEDGAMAACISSEYLYKTSILSQVPLLPLQWQASYCRTDSKRLDLIDELATEVAARLGKHAGNVVCGARPDITALSLVPFAERDTAKLGRSESELFNMLSEERDPGVISDEYFQHLWDNALDDLVSERVVVRKHGALIPSRSIAVIPISCRLKLAAQSVLKAISLYILGALSFVGCVFWARHRFYASRREARKVDELVDEVLRRLVEQQMISLDFSPNEPSHLPVNHLRDLLLPSNTFAASSRKRIWSAVAKRVESNSNVRTGTKRWKGEWSRGWEWIGVSQAASSSTPKTRTPQTTSATPNAANNDSSVIIHGSSESDQGEVSDAVK